MSCPQQVVRLALATALLLPLLHTGTALAALPPYWQRLREIDAILQSTDVHDRLQPSGPIVSIELVDFDVYVIRTATCSLTVNIVDTPLAPGERPLVGPRQFELDLGELECRE